MHVLHISLHIGPYYFAYYLAYFAYFIHIQVVLHILHIFLHIILHISHTVFSWHIIHNMHIIFHIGPYLFAYYFAYFTYFHSYYFTYNAYYFAYYFAYFTFIRKSQGSISSDSLFLPLLFGSPSQCPAVDVPPPTTVTAVLCFITDSPRKIAYSLRMSNGIVPVWRESSQYAGHWNDIQHLCSFFALVHDGGLTSIHPCYAEIQ